jgi:hypothetical protein
MSFPNRVQALVNPSTGELAGAARRYQKPLHDLERVCLDEPAFASLAGVRERAKGAALTAAEARTQREVTQ